MFFLEGMDLRAGNFGDELLNFLDFWRRGTEVGKNLKSFKSWVGLEEIKKLTSWTSSRVRCLPVFRGVYRGGKHGGKDGRCYSYSEKDDVLEGC
jgi:hypothetical protein